MEKRKQATEQLKASRSTEAMSTEDANVLDNLLEKLRSGDAVKKKHKRPRPGESAVQIEGNSVNEAADIARGMLAQLQSSGFDAFEPSPVSPLPSTTTFNPNNSRRSRRRDLSSPTSPTWASTSVPEEPPDNS